MSCVCVRPLVFALQQLLAYILGSWKLLPAYAASLWFARWSDRVTVRGYKYEDKVVDDYMRLYPEKFPEYGKLV